MFRKLRVVNSLINEKINVDTVKISTVSLEFPETLHDILKIYVEELTNRNS